MPCIDCLRDYEDSLDELYRSIHDVLKEVVSVPNFVVALHDPATGYTTIGCMALYCNKDDNCYSQDAMELLAAVSYQITAVIDHKSTDQAL